MVRVVETFKTVRTTQLIKLTGELEQRKFRLKSVEIQVEMPWGLLIFKSTLTHRGWGRWKDSRPGRTLRKAADYNLGEVFNEVKRIAGVDPALNAITEVNGLQSGKSHLAGI